MNRPTHPDITVHPAPEDLMSFLDGELEPSEIAQVRRHLQRCEDCRRTLERFAALTARFSSEALAAGMETPPAAEPGIAPPAEVFVSRGPATVQTLARRSGGERRFVIPRPIAAGIAILLGAALLAHLLLSPRPVSARSLVSTAWQHQRDLQQKHPAVVVQRKLRVVKTVQGKAVNAERWETALAPGAAHEEFVSTGSSAQEILQTLPESRCRLFVPLSLDMLTCLLDSDPLSVQVEETASASGLQQFQIQLTSLAMSGPSVRSRWTLRGSDWRLSDVEYLSVSGPEETVYRIEEESIALVPTKAPEAEISSAEPARESLSVDSAERPVDRVLGVPGAHASLLRVFEAMDRFVPALEEDLRFEMEPNGTVRVTGLVAGEARRVQLESLLAADGGVRVMVMTPEEAVARSLDAMARQESAGSAAKANGSPLSGSATPLRSEGPLLADELIARFGSDEEGKALALRFGALLLEETQQLAFQARWLERLEEAFPPANLAGMSEGEQQRLMALRRRWRDSLREKHADLRLRVVAVVCGSPCAETARADSSAVPQETEAAPSSALTAAWSEALHAELALVKTMLVDRAFAPAGSPEQAKAQWLRMSDGVRQALDQPLPVPQDHSLVSHGLRQAAH
jgi:anti-sigma factor RsiW